MKRLLTSLLIGLLLAAAFLGIAFAADGAVAHLHWLRDIFVGPPLWLLQTGLPAISPALAVERGGPYSGAAFFMAFFIGFWWLICSAIVFSLRRQRPNNSFKPRPLRGSA